MRLLLTTLMLAILSACNGAGGGAANGFAGNGSNNIINYNIKFTSLGAWSGDGLERQPHQFDDQLALYIPNQVSLIQDSASTIQFGDVVRIYFVNDYCTYTWNGSVFSFTSCGGNLAGYVAGQQLTLYEVEGSGAGATNNGKVNIGTVTASNDLHTGFVEVRAYLGE